MPGVEPPATKFGEYVIPNELYLMLIDGDIDNELTKFVSTPEIL